MIGNQLKLKIFKIKLSDFETQLWWIKNLFHS